MSLKIDIRRLSESSFAESLQLWNEGFQGYFVDLTMSLERYLDRLHGDGISPRHSLVALCDGKPAGFLLNAIRNNNGQKVAWNGGTGISPEFRRKGVGKELVRAALELYRTESVLSASLEAIDSNKPAIELYQQFEYDVTERLVLLKCDGPIQRELFTSDAFTTQVRSPAEISSLHFYRHDSAWQAQWQSVIEKRGAALVVRDAANVCVGYALFSRSFAENGDVTAITLFQCEAEPSCPDAREVVKLALSQVFSPFEVHCSRFTSNIRQTNSVVIEELEHLGFSKFVEQLHMIRSEKQ
jgi:GNAT superfamily N-acetyltransferase